MSILIIYRPPHSRGNLYTGFKFAEEFRDFLGGRLNNISIIMGDFNFRVENVNVILYFVALYIYISIM